MWLFNDNNIPNKQYFQKKEWQLYEEEDGANTNYVVQSKFYHIKELFKKKKKI